MQTFQFAYLFNWAHPSREATLLQTCTPSGRTLWCACRLSCAFETMLHVCCVSFPPQWFLSHWDHAAWESHPWKSLSRIRTYGLVILTTRPLKTTTHNKSSLPHCFCTGEAALLRSPPPKWTPFCIFWTPKKSLRGGHPSMPIFTLHLQIFSKQFEVMCAGSFRTLKKKIGPLAEGSFRRGVCTCKLV